MELEMGSKDMGQFFTPFSLSELVAGRVMGQRVQEPAEAHPILRWMSHPRCGDRGGYNPQTQLLAPCPDLDPVAARMWYAQLSWLGIPACVRSGNSLSQKITRRMYMTSWYRIQDSCRKC